MELEASTGICDLVMVGSRGWSSSITTSKKLNIYYSCTRLITISRDSFNLQIGSLTSKSLIHKKLPLIIMAIADLLKQARLGRAGHCQCWCEAGFVFRSPFMSGAGGGIVRAQ